MASSTTREAERPIFQRLLPGPHRLPREAVLRHQHVRLCGALVAALDGYGYDATTVTRLARLAGVSRRAFYEQFANKDDCLLSTFDEVAGELLVRLRDSVAEAGPDPAARLSAVTMQATSWFARDPRWLLLFGETSRCTPGGARRVRQLIASTASMLGGAIAGPDCPPVPPLLLRSAVAGCYDAIVAARVYGCGNAIIDTTAALNAWLTALASTRLLDLLNAPAGPSLQVDDAARKPPRTKDQESLGDSVLRAALRAEAIRQADGGATPATIADEVGVTPEAVLELYPCMAECLEAARALFVTEAITGAEEAATASTTLAAVTRDAIMTLLAVVADRFEILGQPHRVSGRPCANAEELLFRRQVVGQVLNVAGLPALAPVHADATAGAIWYVAAFPAVRSHRWIAAEQLALLALAPHLGADRAVSELLVARSLGTTARSSVPAAVVG